MTITRINGGALIEDAITIQEVARPVVAPSSIALDEKQEMEKELIVYPNPGKEFLNISFNGTIDQLRMSSLDGITIRLPQSAVEDVKSISMHWSQESIPMVHQWRVVSYKI